MAKQRQESLPGIRAATEAIRGGREIDKILIKRGLSGRLFQELFDLIRKEQIEYQFVPAEKIKALSPNQNNQGVLTLIAPISYWEIDDVFSQMKTSEKLPLILILDRITDVRNFGAIARSAECAGVDAIVIPFKHSAKITPDSIKTSAGALYHVPICRVLNLKKLVKELKRQGFWVVAASEKADRLYTDANFNLATAIIMGAEDTGISEDLLRFANDKVKLPVLGKIESLNVSVAASLMMYEALKQRAELKG